MTKIRTTMIGSLAHIEAKLGFLWGQGKPREELTDDELEMGRLKDELRTEILNNGNNQIRAAVAEISQYEVNWNRYVYGTRTTRPDKTRAESPREGMDAER